MPLRKKQIFPFRHEKVGMIFLLAISHAMATHVRVCEDKWLVPELKKEYSIVLAQWWFMDVGLSREYPETQRKREKFMTKYNLFNTILTNQ